MSVCLALYQPDIPQNTGTLIRLAACFGFELHIIHPTGFSFSHRQLKRAGMDYAENARIAEHDSFEAFDHWRTTENKRLILLTTKASNSVYESRYQENDILMTGRESSGVPDAVAQRADIATRIPMVDGVRSINVAVAASLALGEAMRQTNGFQGLT
jgi:tRNA (cytidine/uridine-2'-O-)-methyltransferase